MKQKRNTIYILEVFEMTAHMWCKPQILVKWKCDNSQTYLSWIFSAAAMLCGMMSSVTLRPRISFVWPKYFKLFIISGIHCRINIPSDYETFRCGLPPLEIRKISVVYTVYIVHCHARQCLWSFKVWQCCHI